MTVDALTCGSERVSAVRLGRMSTHNPFQSSVEHSTADVSSALSEDEEHNTCAPAGPIF